MGVSPAKKESCKTCLVSVSKDVEMVFCVAGVGLRDIVLCLQNVSNVILCNRRNTSERLAEDELQTFVAGAAL